MPQACKFLGPLRTCSKFWSALKWSGCQTRWSLQDPSNRNILLHSTSSRSQVNWCGPHSHVCLPNWTGHQHPIYFFQKDLSMNSLWSCRSKTSREDLALAVTGEKFSSSCLSCSMCRALCFHRVPGRGRRPNLWALNREQVIFSTIQGNFWTSTWQFLLPEPLHRACLLNTSVFIPQFISCEIATQSWL